MIIRGWAVGSTGQSAEVELFGDSMPLDARLHRVLRGDVSASFSLSNSIPYGFELELSPSVWAMVSPDAPLKLEVRVDGRPLPPIDLDTNHLRRWMEQWETLQPSNRERELAKLVRHSAAAGGPAILQQLATSGLAAELTRRGIDPNGPMSLESVSMAVPLTDVRGHLEAFKNMAFSGWAVDLEHGAEHFAIRCNGQVIDCDAMRFDRADVNRAVAVAHRHLGFEVPLPASIWGYRDGDGICAVELLVNQTPLDVEPIHLDLTALDAAVLQLKSDEEQAGPGEDDQARVQRNYRKQVLAEHLVEAGGLETLSLASAIYMGQVELGLGLPEGQALRRLIWQMQRQFNRLVQADGSNALDALHQTLQVSGLHDCDRTEFLLTLLPFFCACDRFAEIEPWLPVQHVQPLLAAGDNWRSSLLVPLLIHAGDVEGACEALHKLALDVSNGWIETGCLLDGTRQLVANAQSCSIDSARAGTYVTHFLGLLDAYGGDYWSRLHDRFLIRSLVQLLSHAWLFSDDVQQSLVAAALRHYGLTRPFWDEYAASSRLGSWLEPKYDLERAFDVFRSLDRRFETPTISADDWQGVLEDLSRLRAAGNWDVDQWLRELLLKAVDSSAGGQVPQAAWELLSATERLRAPGVAMSPEQLLRHAAAEGSIQLSPYRSLKQRCVDLTLQVSRAVHEGSITTALRGFDELVLMAGPLLTPTSGCVGIEFVVSAWLTLRAQGGAETCEAPPSLAKAIDKSAHMDVLPAGMVHAYLMLKRSAQDAPAGSVDTLTAAFEAQQGALAKLGNSLMPQLPLTLPCSSVTHTLVAILVDGDAVSRIAGIREGWAADLIAQGQNYVFVLRSEHEQAQLSGDVLTIPSTVLDVGPEAELPLALVRWMLHHTDYSYLYVVDDQCELNVALWCRDQPHLGHHYSGPGKRACFAVSRCAMGLLASVTLHDASPAYPWPSQQTVQEHLALAGVTLSTSDHVAHMSPRVDQPGGGGFFPFRLGPASPTLVERGYAGSALAGPDAFSPGAGRASLQPRHVWPSCCRVSLASSGAHNRLTLMSPRRDAGKAQTADPVVVAVARNERVLAPHFLAHYRSLGVQHFVIVDNMSTDGTLEYLQAQEDVVLYSTDTEYRLSHYGVAWQQAAMAAHCAGKWTLLADFDEFLVYPDCETVSLHQRLRALAQSGSDAAIVRMVDMYPQGPLAQADFSVASPFVQAPCFDENPLVHWKLGSGHYAGQSTWLSAARHRLIADSAPNLYTSQKVALLRYHPSVRLAEGLHYASGLKVDEQPNLWFAHFKYHAGFHAKVVNEVERAQHYNAAEEYKKYLELWRVSGGSMFDSAVSKPYTGGQSFNHRNY